MIKTLTKVDSSMVYAVGYDPKEKLLEIVFTSGEIWRYEKVPADVYEEPRKSNSIGRYMRSNILDCYSEYPVNSERVKILGNHE